jgi:hypothetical protein
MHAYLLSAENMQGEGPLGTTSSGIVRLNVHPCP